MQNDLKSTFGYAYGANLKELLSILQTGKKAIVTDIAISALSYVKRVTE